MLSINNLDRFLPIYEDVKVTKPIEKVNGKKYEVTKMAVRVNGKRVIIKFRRDLETNKIYPDKPKGYKENKNKETKQDANIQKHK